MTKSSMVHKCTCQFLTAVCMVLLFWRGWHRDLSKTLKALRSCCLQSSSVQQGCAPAPSAQLKGVEKRTGPVVSTTLVWLPRFTNIWGFLAGFFDAI